MSESTRQPHERPSVPGAQAVWKGQQHYGLVSITFSKGPGCTPRLPQGAGASTRRVWGRRARAGGVQTNRPPLCRPQLPFTKDKPGLRFRVSISAALGVAGCSFGGGG